MIQFLTFSAPRPREIVVRVDVAEFQGLSSENITGPFLALSPLSVAPLNSLVVGGRIRHGAPCGIGGGCFRSVSGVRLRLVFRQGRDRTRELLSSRSICRCQHARQKHPDHDRCRDEAQANSQDRVECDGSPECVGMFLKRPAA